MSKMIEGTVTFDYHVFTDLGLHDGDFAAVADSIAGKLKTAIVELTRQLNDEHPVMVGIQNYSDSSFEDWTGEGRKAEQTVVSHKLEPQTVGLLYDLLEKAGEQRPKSDLKANIIEGDVSEDGKVTVRGNFTLEDGNWYVNEDGSGSFDREPRTVDPFAWVDELEEGDVINLNGVLNTGHHDVELFTRNIEAHLGVRGLSIEVDFEWGYYRVVPLENGGG